MPTEQEEQASRPHCGRLLRFFWMYGGISVLLIIAAVIMADKLPWFTWVDIPYKGYLLDSTQLYRTRGAIRSCRLKTHPPIFVAPRMSNALSCNEMRKQLVNLTGVK